MINQRKIIVDQIALEVANLGTIDTYNESLASVSIYSALAEDTDVRNLIIQSSQNNTFKSYFENYSNRESQLNPLFTGLADDSAETTAVDEILKLKGLPDVVDFLDLDSVSSKAQRDDRLKTTVSFKGLSTEQIITLACETLKISINNKDVYAKSKSLLANLNNHDRDLVKIQIDANQQIDTLS